MKHLAIITLIGLMGLFYGCNKQSVELGPDEYLIIGLAQRVPDGEIVTLYDEFDNPLATAVVKGEAFEMRGKVDTIMPRRLATPMITGVECLLFIEPGTIRVDLRSASAIGTPFNNEIEILTDSMNIIVLNGEDYVPYLLREWRPAYERHKYDALGAYLFPYIANAISYDELLKELETAATSVKYDRRVQQILRRKRLEAEAADSTRMVQ